MLLLELRLFVLSVRQHCHQLLLVAFVVFVDVFFNSVLSPDVFQFRPSVHKTHFCLPLFGLEFIRVDGVVFREIDTVDLLLKFDDLFVTSFYLNLQRVYNLQLVRFNF